MGTKLIDERVNVRVLLSEDGKLEALFIPDNLDWETHCKDGFSGIGLEYFTINKDGQRSTLPKFDYENPIWFKRIDNKEFSMEEWLNKFYKEDLLRHTRNSPMV